MAKLVCEADTPLCSPVMDSEGQLFVTANLQGKVHHVAEADGGSQLAVIITPSISIPLLAAQYKSLTLRLNRPSLADGHRHAQHAFVSDLRR